MSTSTLRSASQTDLRPHSASLSDLAPDSVSVVTLSPVPVPARRLVVLVPSADVDEVELARRVWELAAPHHLAVLFLALCEREQDEPRLRRCLATLSALTRDDRIAIETHLDYSRNWTRKLRFIVQAGDIIICQAEHESGIQHQPVGQSVAKLGFPIWILKGLSMNITRPRHNFWKEILFWAVSIGVITGFLFLQVRILSISEHWAQNILLYLSIPAEFVLLGIWHAILQ